MVALAVNFAGAVRDATISEAFTVVTCARELGDLRVATCALHVIDALLHRRKPDVADVEIIKRYFSGSSARRA
jgi:hypothetical protein